LHHQGIRICLRAKIRNNGNGIVHRNCTCTRPAACTAPARKC
jgi:hypothetical protein